MGVGGSCGPTGLTPGADGRLLVGCGNNDAIISVLLDPRVSAGPTGSILVVNGIGGEDQVAYDPTTNEYFTASRFQPGGPVLGIIDGSSGALVQTLRTTPNDHSVAVDPLNNFVFVAFGGVAGNDVCPAGCIGVFEAIPEPASTPLVLTALFGLLGLVGWRARRG
jgi:hypothetical protein